MKTNFKRAHVRISGRVQGVFYRMETRSTAEAYGITGWVRNRADGSVEAVFEGDEERVNSIIEWCRQGPSNAIVNHVDIQWEDYVGEFIRFEITY
jgi:acylphosphatase